MPKVPVLKPGEAARLLAVLQFREVRQRGSHKQYRHADGRATTVPFHKGRDISPLLLRLPRDEELDFIINHDIKHRMGREG